MRRILIFIALLFPILMKFSYPVEESTKGESIKTDYTKEKTLFVVGTAHLDTQWRWTIQNTINEYIPNTLRKNFSLFEKFPHYIFSFEGAFRYMLAKEYYPDDYEKLKDYIAKGRWYVCGSSVDACDVNVPSPESLIRHILYGNGFFKKEFGKKSCDIYLPDCFGFGYALPTIAVHCGLKGFSTQKLTWGSAVGTPFDIGLWEGVDGSTVIAAINPGAYTAKITGDLSADDGWEKTIEAQGEKSGLYIGYKYFGVGDIGGAPDEKSVEWLEKSINNDKGQIHIISAPADKLYKDLTPEQAKNLPRYKGELLMTTHATGCYTSRVVMKRWNRKNELLANAVESVSVVADWFGTATYPKEKIRDAWIRFLWHQFHDDLTGTSIPEAYQFSWNDELISQNQFISILKNAVGGVAQGLDTQVKGIPLIIYNPLSIDREDVVCANVSFPNGMPKFIKVYDSSGIEMPSQMLSQTSDAIEISFLARVPSIGFSVYDVRQADEPCLISSSLQITEKSIENERYIVKLNKSGDVASIFDKNEKKEILSEPVRFELLKNISNNWPAWEIKYETVTNKPSAYVKGPAKVRIIEKGPVRATLEITRSAEDSTYIQRISLSTGEAKNRIEFDSDIDWKTKGSLLKASFPMNVSNSEATYDLGVGTIERGNNTKKLYEVPAQQWADITNTDKSYGIAVLNDCKYGWDKPDDNTLRLTLIHTPRTEDRYKDQAVMDIGHHKMLYAICGHKGDWRDGKVSWEAGRLNQPLLAFQTQSHHGSLGKTFSMLKLNTTQVAVKALKKSEEGDEIVVRLQELDGRPAKDVVLSMVGKILSAREINGGEEPIRDANIVDGKLKFDLEPYHPISFTLKIENYSPEPAVQKSSFNPAVCKSINLPFNLDAISFDQNKLDGDFDGAGYSFPAELFPPKLVSEDILFTSGSTEPGQKNAVICRGQEITLSEGDFNRLYILASSVNGDTSGIFKIDGKDYKISIQDYNENIGQWDSSIVAGKFTNDVSLMEPPFLKKDPIAWLGTHRHKKDNTNDAYKFCYIFKYSIPLPKVAKKLTLPNNENIRIFAITSAYNPNDDIILAQPIYDEVPGLPLFIKAKTRIFIDSITVPITCIASAAQIHYTLDDSEPTQSSNLYKEPLKLTETCTLKAKAFKEGKGESNVISVKFEKVTPRESVNPQNLVSGLDYSYYEGMWKNLPRFNKIKPIKTGKIENVSLSPRLRDENYGLKFSGFINIPEDDIYIFYTKSDDGSKLYIGDEEVVNNDGLHGAEERTGTVALKAGKHPITITFFQRGGDHSLEVGYAQTNKSKEQLKSSDLFSLKSNEK